MSFVTGSSLLAFDADNVHPAATPAPGFIDLSTVAHSVVTVPHQLEELQRAIVVSCAALAVIGLVNAVLLVCLLMGRRRERTAQPIAESSATVSAGIAAVKTPRAADLRLWHDHFVALEIGALPAVRKRTPARPYGESALGACVSLSERRHDVFRKKVERT